MPSEFDGILAIEAFKELVEGLGTMRLREEDVINKMQPEAGLLESRMKVIFFTETHDQDGVKRDIYVPMTVPLT